MFHVETPEKPEPLDNFSIQFWIFSMNKKRGSSPPKEDSCLTFI